MIDTFIVCNHMGTIKIILKSRSGYFFMVVLLAIFFMIGCKRLPAGEDTLPNIILIFTDQQNIDAMSAMGNPFLQTPHMDRIAKRGVIFTESYCTSPVCGPSRSSILTGHMPHTTGVEWNGQSVDSSLVNVGEIFRNAGYQTVWGGKWHLPEGYPQRSKAEYKETRGFDLLPFRDPDQEYWFLGTETDPPLTEAVIGFLNQHQQESPFFLAVSYHNPHDICMYPRKNGWMTMADSLVEVRYYDFEYRLPDVIATHPKHFSTLPPLPPNHNIGKEEPEFVGIKREVLHRYGTETHLSFGYSEEEWRGYLNAYYRLTEMVDAEIGKVMDALEENGLLRNTIVVFTSDHGDGAAAHKWSAKLSLYKESVMVPMIISWPGQIREGQVDKDHFVSVLDITPTLCDLTGIQVSTPFTGKSLKPLLKPGEEVFSRDYIVVELADDRENRYRKGRLIRTEKYHYAIYSNGEDQLYDLVRDPGEMHNLSVEPEYDSVRLVHQEMLSQWMTATGDDFTWLQSAH